MNTMKFKAFAVADEIDLNKIALKMGMPKKYTWEEPLTIQGQLLEELFGHTLVAQEQVNVFAFGSIVFINVEEIDYLKVLLFLKAIETRIDIKNIHAFTDDYELIVDETLEEIVITDGNVAVPALDVFYPELVSIVIAKSVGLEKIEQKITVILDGIENKIDRLESGKMRISDKELAKTISKILRHEYTTISYIMILDRPDVTWSHMEAANFYDRMSEFFELSDRYEILKTKTNILNDIIDGFSTISHSMRGLFIEWLIVILIIAEVILMTIDILK
jgi:required for meiotic nuclear division protein 1